MELISEILTGASSNEKLFVILFLTITLISFCGLFFAIIRRFLQTTIERAVGKAIELSKNKDSNEKQ